MSTVLLDILHGNFSQAVIDFNTWWDHVPAWAKNFLTKIKGDEGAILQSLVSVAVEDVKNGGLTTASFVAAGKDVFAKLAAQNISTFNLQYVIAAINLAVADAGLVKPEVASAATTPTV